jgi:N-acetylglutamate synthase-like GNAT family acetyltransferase
MELRPYRDADASAVDALLDASFAGDPVLRGIVAVHAVARGTLVADDRGEVAGVATLRHSDRHPSRLFLAGAVHPRHRERGIGGALFEALDGGGRPLLARVRDPEDAGGRFLARRGFRLLMRNVVVVVEPGPGGEPELPAPGSLEELALAHEEAYRRQHASWFPVTDRPLDESLRLFCGPSRVASALIGSGVASVYDAGADLELIAGAEDDATADLLVEWALGVARRLGKPLSIEADEADAPFWRIASTLPSGRREPLFLLATDVTRGRLPT